MNSRRASLFLLTLGAAGCAASADGPAIESEALCAEVARVLCETDATCCEDRLGSDCEDVETAACDASLGALLGDPRLSYVPTRGGGLVDRLEGRGCTSDPLPLAYFEDLFVGTGELGADCTPEDASPGALRSAALSCVRGTACRLHLDARGEAQGFCESRESAGELACSHPSDCAPDLYCNLPVAWQPGDWGHCQPQRSDGWTCASDRECASGACSAGVCGAARTQCLTLGYEELVLAAGPLLYLRLGERSGSVAADHSEHADGRYSGAVVHDGEGAVADDGALSVAGMGYVTVASIDGLSDDALTIELWIEGAEGLSGPLVDLTSEDGDLIALRVEGDRLIASFRGATEETAIELATEAGAVVPGFQQVVLRYDGASAQILASGAVVASLEGERVIPAAFSTSIGFHDEEGEELDRALTGRLDEVAIYPSAVSLDALGAHRAAAAEGFVASEPALFGWAR